MGSLAAQTSTGVRHEDLDEIAGIEEVACRTPVAPERRHERDDHHRARLDHEAGDLSHATNVLGPVLGGESEVLVQAVADVVTVEDERAHALGVQVPLDGVGDRGLARPGQPGEPQDPAVMAVEALAGGAVDDELVAAHIRRPPQA